MNIVLEMPGPEWDWCNNVTKLTRYTTSALSLIGVRDSPPDCPRLTDNTTSLRRAAPVRGCVGMCHKSVLRGERELGPLRTILNPSANMFVQCTAATLHSAAFPILTLASLKVTRDTQYCWHLLPSVSQVWHSHAMNLLRMNSRCPLSINSCNG